MTDKECAEAKIGSRQAHNHFHEHAQIATPQRDYNHHRGDHELQLQLGAQSCYQCESRIYIAE